MRITLLLTISLLMLTGCPGGKERAGRVAANVIDCLTPDATEAIRELSPALADVVRNATSPDGNVDGARIKAIGSSLLRPAAQCAMTSVLAELMRPAAADPNAPKSTALVANTTQARALFEELRASWGGHKYQLASGTL